MRDVNRDGRKFGDSEPWGINGLRDCQAAESSSRQEAGEALAFEWTIIWYVSETVDDAMLVPRKRIFGRIYSCEGPVINTCGYCQGRRIVIVH